MSKLIRILLASVALGLSLGTGSALAQDEAGLSLMPAPVDRLDDASLQRGARDFVNYCLTCHTAKYMRYNRLEDIGLTPVEIADNLMFATKRIGDPMTVAMTAEDAAKWFPAPPPDLTLEARIRGRDWLYSYLLGFYRDEKSASGWNNLVFPNVSMPNVLWQLSGTNKLVETEYDEHAKAAGAQIAVKGLSMLEEKPGGKYAVLTLAPDVPGMMTRTEYEAFVGDLVNYLDYMGEPIKNKRIHLGIIVLLFLGVLFAFAYALKREYWKELH